MNFIILYQLILLLVHHLSLLLLLHLIFLLLKLLELVHVKITILLIGIKVLNVNSGSGTIL